MTLSAQDWRRIQKTKIGILAYQTHRPITWKEASRMLRSINRRPSIAQYYGKPILVGDFYGKSHRIMSMNAFRSMTPAQFWQRLQHIDYYCVSAITSIRW